jgi:hypothetical protein
MKAEVLFQPRPGADNVLVSAEVADDQPIEKLIEAVALSMRDAAGPRPQIGPFTVKDGKLVPWRDTRDVMNP